MRSDYRCRGSSKFEFGGENVPEKPKEVIAIGERLNDLTEQVEKIKKTVSRLEQDVSMLKRPWM